MSQQLDELRVVLLGSIESGKTSVVNTLLCQRGPEIEKRTINCVRREGEVNGRKLILINTPEWWGNFPLTDTANVIKQRLVLCVSACPPGPQAFLLVIGCNTPFTESNRRSIEEHLGLFGENIWEHTIVVFTRGEHLKSKTIEQHIEREAGALKWITEKCGDRYYMFYTHTESCNELQKLLERINVLAKATNHFKLDEKRLEDVERTKQSHQEQGKLRQQQVINQREILQQYGVIPSLPELRILLLGWLYSGKTTAKHTILGQTEDAHKLNRGRTYRSERNSKEVAGRLVSVVDTPSWWKYLSAKYTPEWVKAEIERGLTLDCRVPHAILLAVPVDTAFQEEQRSITEDNMKMFGDQVWKHTIVLFTCGDLLGDTSIEEHIESEGEPLQWLVEKCGNRYHVLSWYDKEDKIMELQQKIEEMAASNSLFSPEPKPHKKVVKEQTTEEPDEVQRKVAHLLDGKWRRMDEEMEKRIRNICSKIADMKRERSITPDLDFSGSHSSSEEGKSKNILEKAMNPPITSESKCTIKESAIDEFTGHKDQEQISETGEDQLERMRDVFEKELRRLEVNITQRFQWILFELRESGSEADEHELNQSFKKVIWWMHDSGIGTEIDPEETE